MASKPILGGPPPKANPKINAGAAPDKQLWSFSFRYLREMRYFGVGAKDAGWFTAMFEKLAELSKKTIASTNANLSEKKTWRLHEIDWESKSVPIRRDDLNWIDRAYLHNDAEYPMQQFQITKALGRVIGFFDERQIFNVVLLDPMHNMQPSKDFDYKLRSTIVSETHSAAIARFVEGQLSECKQEKCVCRLRYADFQKQMSNNDGGTTLLVHLSRELFERVASCVSSGTADSISDILALSMDGLEK